MRTVTKLVLVGSMSLVSAIVACSGGGGDNGDSGTDSGSDVVLKKESGTKDGGDGAVVCTADTTYGSVSNQMAAFFPTPTDGGTDAATTDAATTDATTDADDGGADADDGSADADDGSVEASLDGGAADGGSDGGTIAGGPEDYYLYQGDLNGDIDYLDIQLYTGFGVFTNGIKAGTYQLTGDELDYATCGVCVLIRTDTTSTTITDSYMATGGTVVISEISPSQLTGTLTNVTFTHVTIDDTTFESTPVNDGCNSTIASLSISAAVTVGQ